MNEKERHRSKERKRYKASRSRKSVERISRKSKHRVSGDDKFLRDSSRSADRSTQKMGFQEKDKIHRTQDKERNDEQENSVHHQRHETDLARNEKYREMKELERATRTVFVNNLHIKVNEKDLFILFSQKAGKVIDIYVICDKHTNKSKGLAYVELETIESMTRALGSSGSEMYGQSIQVKPSEMEKNVQWTLQKQAQQGIMASLPTPTTSATSLPTPGVNIVDAATLAATKLLMSNESHTLHGTSINSQEDQRQRKIYIGNLPREINEVVLRNMFEPFGAVESSNVIKDPTGKSQGYGFISFHEKDVVEKAIQAMNGMLIGSNIIKVNYVTSGGCQQLQQPISSGQPQTIGTPISPFMSNVDLDRVDDDGGLKINAQNRIILMQKLASSAHVDLSASRIPVLPVQRAPEEIKNANSSMLCKLQGLLGPSSPTPTNCLLLKNMFDPKETNNHKEWDLEISKDVKEEVMKIGSVSHLFLDKNSQGFVYIKMATIDAATHTFNMLNGRIYGGRQIHVEYQSVQMYEQIFI